MDNDHFNGDPRYKTAMNYRNSISIEATLSQPIISTYRPTITWPIESYYNPLDHFVYRFIQGLIMDRISYYQHGVGLSHFIRPEETTTLDWRSHSEGWWHHREPPENGTAGDSRAMIKVVAAAAAMMMMIVMKRSGWTIDWITCPVIS